MLSLFLDFVFSHGNISITLYIKVLYALKAHCFFNYNVQDYLCRLHTTAISELYKYDFVLNFTLKCYRGGELVRWMFVCARLTVWCELEVMSHPWLKPTAICVYKIPISLLSCIRDLFLCSLALSFSLGTWDNQCVILQFNSLWHPVDSYNGQQSCSVSTFYISVLFYWYMHCITNFLPYWNHVS